MWLNQTIKMVLMYLLAYVDQWPYVKGEDQAKIFLNHMFSETVQHRLAHILWNEKVFFSLLHLGGPLSIQMRKT